MRFRSLAEAVVGVRPLVVARQPLEPRVLGDPQRDPVPGTKLLQLGHYALGHARHALGVEAIHHPLHEVDLVLDRVVDEIRVDKHLVRGSQALVPAEEEGGRGGLDVADLGLLGLLLVGGGTGVVVVVVVVVKERRKEGKREREREREEGEFERWRSRSKRRRRTKTKKRNRVRKLTASDPWGCAGASPLRTCASSWPCP
jgi:hypothetical protein